MLRSVISLLVGILLGFTSCYTSKDTLNCPEQNKKLLSSIVEKEKLICIYEKSYTKLQRKERLELFRKGQL